MYIIVLYTNVVYNVTDINNEAMNYIYWNLLFLTYSHQ